MRSYWPCWILGCFAVGNVLTFLSWMMKMQILFEKWIATKNALKFDLPVWIIRSWTIRITVTVHPRFYLEAITKCIFFCISKNYWTKPPTGTGGSFNDALLNDNSWSSGSVGRRKFNGMLKKSWTMRKATPTANGNKYSKKRVKHSKSIKLYSMCLEIQNSQLLKNVIHKMHTRSLRIAYNLMQVVVVRYTGWW